MSSFYPFKNMPKLCGGNLDRAKNHQVMSKRCLVLFLDNVLAADLKMSPEATGGWGSECKTERGCAHLRGDWTVSGPWCNGHITFGSSSRVPHANKDLGRNILFSCPSCQSLSLSPFSFFPSIPPVPSIPMRAGYS